MENTFIITTLALFILMVLTMVRLIQDIRPHLSEEDQFCLHMNKSWINFPSTLRARWRFGRAIQNAWNSHVRLFPRSRKRVLFACLLIVFFFSIMAYPLWLALGVR
jgi:hypothetical protein